MPNGFKRRQTHPVFRRRSKTICKPLVQIFSHFKIFNCLLFLSQRQMGVMPNHQANQYGQGLVNATTISTILKPVEHKFI